jgi:hypothetical protein
LADTCERQAAERGKPSRGETGTAQEAATIKPAAWLRCKPGRECNPARLAFRPLDEHGRYLFFG